VCCWPLLARKVEEEAGRIAENLQEFVEKLKKNQNRKEFPSIFHRSQ
jgi:hypothetical protein